jgi:hypothetical protein
MKKTLLRIVQDILEVLDSDEVNSIGDTAESIKMARIVEQTFYDIIATREFPEHQELIKLTPLSDTDYPTHFVLEDDQAKIDRVWYDKTTDNSYKYTEINWLEPGVFLDWIDRRGSDYVLVDDKSAGTKLRIYNKQGPNYYTSFDDKHIVFDAYNSEVDDNLQESKVRALGRVYPTFLVSDDYVPDIDASAFPHLISEATSRATSIEKGVPDQKIEQAARRNKVQLQNDKYRLKAPDKRRNYGRR